jgi:hypothetical protein
VADSYTRTLRNADGTTRGTVDITPVQGGGLSMAYPKQGGGMDVYQLDNQASLTYNSAPVRNMSTLWNDANNAVNDPKFQKFLEDKKIDQAPFDQLASNARNKSFKAFADYKKSQAALSQPKF